MEETMDKKIEEIIDKLTAWQEGGDDRSVFLIATDDKKGDLYYCLQGDKDICKKGFAIKIDTDKDFLDIARFVQTFLMLRESKKNVN